MNSHPTILYIEDNHDNQRLVQRIMEARGYRVLIAEDGPHGIALARTAVPALILVDLNIPGLDGYETTTRLRSIEQLHKIPIVALTADTRTGTRERSLVAGCDGYLTKPIDPRSFPDQLYEFIGGKQEQVPPAVETAVLREYNQKLVERLERQVRDLMNANAELQELDTLKSQFLASLSHELRTPLTSILGYLDLFERRMLGPLNEAQLQGIDVITRNARLLSRLLNNLIYLQEVRSMPLRRVPISPHDILRQTVADLQAAAAAHNITLHTIIERTEMFHGDPIGLGQTFHALIDNAIKFSPSGGEVTIQLNDDIQAVRLAIVDNGPGIAPEQYERIFQPFIRLDPNAYGPDAGAGLGLTIARHVAEAHGGGIQLSSTPGEGSTFTLTLPRL